MKPLYLKFDSEKQANDLLFITTENPHLADDSGNTMTYMKSKWQNVSVVGHITVDDLAVDGWHVNVLLMDGEDITPLEPFLIEVKSPMRVWAGVNDGN